MKLHEAIERLLQQRGAAMRATEIAATLNKNHWYVKGNGSPIQPSQIRLRAINYPNLLKYQDGVVSLVGLSESKFVIRPTIEASSVFQTTSTGNKDEAYVLDLCDAVLGEKSLRQHQFDFLRGDSGRRLPVDGYYIRKNLVVEYYERQHTEAVAFFDKPHRMTVSGVPRSEQRAIYDQRRKSVLKEHKIGLAILAYSNFSFDSNKRIIRDQKSDINIVRKALSEWC